MNMFRNILTVVTLAFGRRLYFLPIEDWTWLDAFGPEPITWVDLLLKAQPFPTIVLMVVAVALFMTRKQY